MNERLRLKDASFKKADEVFSCRLPGTQLQEVNFNELPTRIRKYIGSERDFGMGLRVLHLDDTLTLIGEDASCELVYLQDLNRNLRYIGEGQIYIENVDDELYIPVVGFTQTLQGQRRKGYGRRRLTVMDCMSRILYDQPIFSSTSPKPKQRSIWERLVAEEYAETHDFDGIRRFKFA